MCFDCTLAYFPSKSSQTHPSPSYPLPASSPLWFTFQTLKKIHLELQYSYINSPLYSPTSKPSPSSLPCSLSNLWLLFSLIVVTHICMHICTYSQIYKYNLPSQHTVTYVISRADHLVLNDSQLVHSSLGKTFSCFLHSLVDCSLCLALRSWELSLLHVSMSQTCFLSF